jgi:hypothetical protein
MEEQGSFSLITGKNAKENPAEITGLKPAILTAKSGSSWYQYWLRA